MKHITDFKNHIAALRGVADDNGNLPETREELRACTYDGETPDLTTEDGYDTWSDFLFSVNQAIKVADGTAAKLVQSLAQTAWREVDDHD